MRDQEGNDVKAIQFYIKTYSSGWVNKEGEERGEEASTTASNTETPCGFHHRPCNIWNGAQQSVWYKVDLF